MVSSGNLPNDWLPETRLDVPAQRDSQKESQFSHTQTLSHDSQWDPSMLCNPHVTTESSSVMDQVLDVRNWANIEQPFGCLAAFEAGSATSTEKAFVNLQFNELSTSVHADDSLFSLVAFSVWQRSLGVSRTLSHTRQRGQFMKHL